MTNYLGGKSSSRVEPVPLVMVSLMPGVFTVSVQRTNICEQTAHDRVSAKKVHP